MSYFISAPRAFEPQMPHNDLAEHHRNLLRRPKFGWQDEYFAVSVSEANVPAVKKYIANQDEHHRTKSFEDEFEGFMKRAGFQRFKDSEGSY